MVWKVLFSAHAIKGCRFPSDVKIVEDEYLTKDSVLFHEKLGYTMVGTFHQCGYKFHCWYDMVWMEKFIGEHRENQPDIIPCPKLKMEK